MTPRLADLHLRAEKRREDRRRLLRHRKRREDPVRADALRYLSSLTTKQLTAVAKAARIQFKSTP